VAGRQRLARQHSGQTGGRGHVLRARRRRTAVVARISDPREGRMSATSPDRPQKFFMDPPESSEYFFEAAREGKFVIQKCGACGDYQFYPRKICIHCGSPDVEWAQASGRGVVHTFTVIHRGMPGWREEGPYV